MQQKHRTGFAAWCHQNDNQVLIEKGGIMECPACHGPMYDNRGKKKNPASPDYRCKNQDCRTKLNPMTGKYEEGSDWPTGVWLEKDTTIIDKTPNPTPASNGNGDKTNAMLMSYAKDLVIAELATNPSYPEDPVDRVINIYKRLKTAL